jgi:hypothetical protein
VHSGEHGNHHRTQLVILFGRCSDHDAALRIVGGVETHQREEQTAHERGAGVFVRHAKLASLPTITDLDEDRSHDRFQELTGLRAQRGAGQQLLRLLDSEAFDGRHHSLAELGKVLRRLLDRRCRRGSGHATKVTVGQVRNAADRMAVLHELVQEAKALDVGVAVEAAAGFGPLREDGSVTLLPHAERVGREPRHLRHHADPIFGFARHSHPLGCVQRFPCAEAV